MPKFNALNVGFLWKNRENFERFCFTDLKLLCIIIKNTMLKCRNA